ncbi:MAG TPA: two-component regulator propeller domain-containing protein, partial [Blastocatellia bacterium]
MPKTPDPNRQNAARAGQYYFDSWTTDNGLPQNTVDAICQTQDGYLWIATADGLVRYDGARFVVFNSGNTPGINDNRCLRLLEDRSGALWIVNQFGLMSYRDGTFQSYTTADGLPDGIFQFFEDDLGGLILVSRRGIFLWRNGQSTRLDPEGNRPGDFGYKDRSRGIWYSVGSDLANITADGRFFRYPKPWQGRHAEITCMHQDRGGDLWVGAYAGLYRLINGEFFHYDLKGELDRAPISCISEDAGGTLWISTMPGDLFHLPADLIGAPGIAEPTPASIDFNPPAAPAGNHADVIFSDREGTIWLGTNLYGLLRMNKKVVTVYSKEDGLSSDNIYPVYEDRRGTVWIGNWQGPPTVFKDGHFSQSGEWTLPTAFAEDRDGNLWMGKNVGLLRFDGTEWIDEQDVMPWPTSHGYEVDAIHQDREGTLWFGTDFGLVSYREGARKLYTTSEGLAGDSVKVILEDREGALWFGTYGGLTRLKNGIFTSYKKSDGLASDRVRSLYQDGDGVIWVGTYDGGLSRIKDGHITNYTTNDGLFNNGVFQILDDQCGNLWMSSNLGIYRVSRQELNDFAEGKIHQITSVSYGKRDGMLNVECNGGTSPAGVRTRDGRLWFPTQKGVAVINPADVPVNSLPPPVLVESLIIDGVPARMQGPVKITPGQEDLEIHYTGLSFINPEHVRFRYRMEGLDKDWVEAGTRRTAFYSHVPPGRYKFDVIAANASGVWSLEGASLDVIFEPPFWRTWWFYVIATATLLSITFALYWRRVAMLKHAASVQEAFSRQLIDSQEGERKRIAAELHDSLGQSLSIIMSRAALVLNKPEDPKRAFDQVGEIAATASDAMKEVREIAYDLRPVELDRLGLTKALRTMTKKMSASTGIAITADIDEIDDLFPGQSEINLYRVVQESINNIVKHSGASRASVEIKRAGRELSITIQDNGKGFESASPSDGR